MWYIKLDGKYLTLAGKWTEKRKDARSFETALLASRVVRAKKIEGAVISTI